MSAKISKALNSLSAQMTCCPLKQERCQIKNKIIGMKGLDNAKFIAAYKDIQSQISAFSTKCKGYSGDVAGYPAKLARLLADKKTEFVAKNKKLIGCEIEALETESHIALAPLKKDFSVLIKLDPKKLSDDSLYSPETEAAATHLLSSSNAVFLELQQKQLVLASNLNTLCELEGNVTEDSQAQKELIEALGSSTQKCEELYMRNIGKANTTLAFFNYKKQLETLEVQVQDVQAKFAALKSSFTLTDALELRDAYKKLESEACDALNKGDGLPKSSTLKQKAIAIFTHIRQDRRELQNMIPTKRQQEIQEKAAVEEAYVASITDSEAPIAPQVPDSPVAPSLTVRIPSDSEIPPIDTPIAIILPAQESQIQVEGPIQIAAPVTQKENIQPVQAEAPKESKGFSAYLWVLLCDIGRFIVWFFTPSEESRYPTFEELSRQHSIR